VVVIVVKCLSNAQESCLIELAHTKRKRPDGVGP
jgi:hypothetical protein